MFLAGIDINHTSEFFSEVWQALDPDGRFQGQALLAVVHALGSHVPFFDQIGRTFDKVLFNVKTRSQDPSVVQHMTHNLRWVQAPYVEDDIAYHSATASFIDAQFHLPPSKDIHIIDVGGKWAAGEGAALRELLASKNVHVVEGTENGYKKYEDLMPRLSSAQSSRLRVWSVARSRLKDAEDLLTGTAIVEATETIVRTNYGLLKDHPATVFGYGKIGRSVARALRDKHLTVGVVEIDPLLRILAQADGFEIRTHNRACALGGYVFLATGSATKPSGLHSNILERFEKDALVTFVTSFDDELKSSDEFRMPGFLTPVHEFKPSELLAGAMVQDCAPRRRVRADLIECLHKYPKNARAQIVIVNRGSPPNFLFEASCGPYIYLVFCGMLACLYRSWEGTGEEGRINVLSRSDEDLIGEQWLVRFAGERS